MKNFAYIRVFSVLFLFKSFLKMVKFFVDKKIIGKNYNFQLYLQIAVCVESKLIKCYHETRLCFASIKTNV